MKDYQELVNQYKNFRKINRELHSKILKHLPKKAIEHCGKKLGVMQGKTLILGDMHDSDVFMDFCLYDYYENGINANIPVFRG